MLFDSPEHQLAKKEIRDKTLSSYFWAATAGITAVAGVVLTGGLLATPTLLEGVGLAITLLGGLGAGIQSYSYDREADALHEKLEIELSKGGEVNTKQLAGIMEALSQEVHDLQQQTTPEPELAPKRDDGLLWTQFIEQQRTQPVRTPEPSPASH